MCTFVPVCICYCSTQYCIERLHFKLTYSTKIHRVCRASFKCYPRLTYKSRAVHIVYTILHLAYHPVRYECHGYQWADWHKTANHQHNPCTKCDSRTIGFWDIASYLRHHSMVIAIRATFLCRIERHLALFIRYWCALYDCSFEKDPTDNASKQRESQECSQKVGDMCGIAESGL